MRPQLAHRSACPCLFRPPWAVTQSAPSQLTQSLAAAVLDRSHIVCQSCNLEAVDQRLLPAWCVVGPV